MTFFTTLRLREPSRPPTLWLVPKWWAFSRDDRYKIGSAVDRRGGGGGRQKGNGKPTHRDVSHQQADRPGRGYGEPRVARELSRPLNRGPVKARTCSEGVVHQQPQSCEIEISKATRALIPNLRTITTPSRSHDLEGRSENHTHSTSARQIDPRFHSTAHYQASRLPARRKKGQTERCVQRASHHQRLANPKDDPGCQAIKLNNANLVLESNVPAQVSFAHTSNAIQQHRHLPESSSLQSHEDDPIYVAAIEELQKNLIQALLLGQNDHAHHHGSKPAIQNTGNSMEKALPISPVTTEHYVTEPGTTKTRTCRLDPIAHTPITHSCTQSSPLPCCQKLDPSYKDMDHTSQAPAERSEYPLHGARLNEPHTSPLNGHLSNQYQTHGIHPRPPYYSPIDHGWHQHPVHAHCECLHQARNDASQDDHDYHHAQYRSWSDRLSSDHVNQQSYHIRQNVNHKPENRCNYHSNEHEDSFPYPDILTRHKKTHKNCSADPHNHHHHHDLSDRCNYHCRNDCDNSCAIHLPHEPMHHHETTNLPDHHIQHEIYQPQLNPVHNQARRMSYVRTRRRQ